MDIARTLCEESGLAPFQVENTLALFDEGATVPFIARYRKERTGSLDEIQIRDLGHRYTYFKELAERKQTVRTTIREQGKLTPELEQRIDATLSKTELEDLYLPYKPKRQTRATRARDAGLEPLARWLRESRDPSAEPIIRAVDYLNPDKGYDTAVKALLGACDILAEELAEDAPIRKHLREYALEHGVMECSVRKEFEGKKTKYEMYYRFSEKVATLPSHRILAMLRGEKEKVLRVALSFNLEPVLGYLEKQLIEHENPATEPALKVTARDALERLLMVATETEIRRELRERAENEAFVVFCENLRSLLLAPPAGQKPVLALDPGFRTGCKVVALDATGKFLQYETVYPHPPQNRTEEAAQIVRALIEKHRIELIAIGNGTAGRETERFVRSVLETLDTVPRPVALIVNESGASVYSASDVAIAEFPDHDLTVRGSVSIGRRLQDPLSELVKIDPKSIGVGQYQHDVNQSRLRERLEEVVESCVNRVGVNTNQASAELLGYVAGLNRVVAKNIVSWRDEHGRFSSRSDLAQVPGLGARTFEQAAGFLRVPDSANPLDNSAVHPERYALVEAIAADLHTTVKEIVGNAALLKTVRKEHYINEQVGLPTIEDILAELEKPGRDPRDTFTWARLREGVTEVGDLEEGMTLEGTVTNVTNFGAFVDIGVHQDGLVHISELCERYVDDPRKVVGVGQVVKVRVLCVDTHLKRISLSMKLDPATRHRDTPPVQGAKKPPRRTPPPAQKATVEQLARKVNQAQSTPGKLKTCKPKFSVKQFMR